MNDDEQLSFEDEDYIPSYVLEEEAAETPEPSDVTYTKAEIEKMLADARAEAQAEAVKEMAPKADPYPLTSDAALTARQAIRLEEQLVREAKNDLPDMPQDVEDELRTFLSQFTTLEQLKHVQAAGYHKTKAESEYFRRVRSGKLVPTTLTGFAQAAPTGSIRPTRLNDSTNREVAEMEQILGIKFTPQDLKKGGLM